VLDPACGDGTLLAVAARQLGPGLHYVGRDRDGTQLAVARSALAGAGATRVDIAPGPVAALAHHADAVISIIPATGLPAEGTTWEYGQPSRADQPLGWVQVCLATLEPGGTAVVAVPFAVAVRASARRIRADLLRAGALTHVIGLPEKVGPAGRPWQIWMLTRPAGRPAYVLRMVELVDRDPDELPIDAAAWAAVFAHPARTRDVPSIELLDEDVFLVPAAHLTPPPRDFASEYADVRKRYVASAGRLPVTAPALPSVSGEPAGTPPASTLVTVADLVRSGALRLIDRDAAGPGDVVVPATPGRFDAYVLDGSGDQGGGDLGGGSANGTATSVLRCDPAALDPYFLAGFLRSEINRRQAAGTIGGTFRLDVRRARVPRMLLSQQRRYGEQFRRLMEFAGTAAEVAAAAAAATRTAIDGLTSGTFAPEEPGK
jgi:SAM-dependent methyltransferase